MFCHCKLICCVTLMFNFRVRWSPVSFCSKTQLMWTSRTLRAEDPSTTPPCWDTRGLSHASRHHHFTELLLREYWCVHFEECNTTPSQKNDKLLSLFQASVLILKKRSESKCCRHRRENTPDNSGGGGQRRHRHTVSVIIMMIFGIIFLLPIFILGELFELPHCSTQPTSTTIIYMKPFGLGVLFC